MSNQQQQNKTELSDKLKMIGGDILLIFSTIICFLVAIVIWFPKIYYTYVNNRFLRI